MIFYYYINFTYMVEMDYMINIVNDNTFDSSNNYYKINVHIYSLLLFMNNLNILYKNYLILYLVFSYIIIYSV